MSRHDEALRQLLGREPASAARIGEVLGVSQQAVSSAVVALGDEVVRIGAARRLAICCATSGVGCRMSFWCRCTRRAG